MSEDRKITPLDLPTQGARAARSHAFDPQELAALRGKAQRTQGKR